MGSRISWMRGWWRGWERDRVGWGGMGGMDGMGWVGWDGWDGGICRGVIGIWFMGYGLRDMGYRYVLWVMGYGS